MTVERLSWAAGPVVVDGWHHSDVQFYDGYRVGWQWPKKSRIAEYGADHVGPIQSGLPWEDGTMDYCVSMHGLMMLPEPDLIPALAELRRVTKPGGWLRVSVPDIQAATKAYVTMNRDWFPVDARNSDEAFCRYVTQNGATRSIFTGPRLAWLLVDAGWESISPTVAGMTIGGPDGITELDSRPNESIFMEAVKS